MFACCQQHPKENFSLKSIIYELREEQRKEQAEKNKQEEDAENVHPLLKKISQERWYAKDAGPVTLDSVIDTIVDSVPNATKSTMKALMAHTLEIDR